MYRQLLRVAIALALVQGLAGCNSSPSKSPSAPSPAPPAVAQPAASQLAGKVYDSAFRPLAGARVEVVDGPQAGRSTAADAMGNFSLAGVFDDTTRFRATKDGHLAGIGTRGPHCDRCNPNWWLYFYLSPLAPPVNLAGNYAVTFSADSACPGLPTDVRTRTYAATIALAPNPDHPADTMFRMTLSGPPFLDDYKRFDIFVAGDYVSGWLGDLHGAPGLVEQIGANTYVTLGGWFGGMVAGSTISASFDGVVERCELTSEWGSRRNCSAEQVVAHAQCASTNHRLILTRR
jgi:hypothetical protein